MKNAVPFPRYRRLLFVAGLLLTLLAGVYAFGQATISTGAIQGTVTDQSDAVIPGVEVTIRNVATAQTVVRTTSSAGVYNSGPLTPGNYTVSVNAKGFAATNLPTVVTIGNITPGNIKLGIASEAQEVTVEANGVTINTEQATVQGVITSEQIENLPINGRNFLDAAQLEPGVQIQDGSNFDPTKNGFTGISVGGRAGRTTRIEVDGVDVTDETVGTTTQNIPASSIQEFQLSQSSLDASTELTSSGAVNVLTKSGTNSIHGDAFYLFRDKRAGDANFPGGADVPFQRNHTGFTLGGPIIKDRLFFFAAGENITQHLFQPVIGAGPFGALSGGYGAPYKEKNGSGRLDYNLKGSAKLFYKFTYDENLLASSQTNFQPFKNQDNTPAHTVGLDFNTGTFTHSLRYEYLKFHNLIGDAAQLSGAFDPIPNAYIHITAISPVFNTGPNDLAPQGTFQTDNQVKYDGSKVWGAHIIRYGASFNAIRGGGFASFFGLAPRIASSASASRQAKAATGPFPGGASNPLNYPITGIILGNGQGSFTESPAFGLPGGGQSDNRFSFYVGDAWKIRPNITISYALRYVRDTGRTDSDLAPIPCSAINLANVSEAPPCTGNLLDNFGNQPGLGNRVNNPSANFAPQAGLTWDPFHTGKTVIRLGGGLFYENAIFNNVLFDRPVRLPTGLFNTFFTGVCPGGIVPFPNGVSVTTIDGKNIKTQICNQPIGSVAQNVVDLQNSYQAAVKAAGASTNPNYVGETLDPNLGGNLFAPNYKSPSSWQMNVGLQHEFGRGTVVSADYIRNISMHFLLGIDTNHVGDARYLNKTAATNAIAATTAGFGCAGGASAAAINCAIGMGAKIGDFAGNGLDSGVTYLGGQPAEQNSALGVDPSMGAAFAGINPFYGQNTMLFPIGRSDYNALEISVRQRLVSNPFGWMPFVHGVNAQFSYTLSRFNSSAGDQDFINSALDMANPSQYFGPTSFDRTNQFAFGTIVNLPAHVLMSFIGHFNSPLPTTLQIENLSRPGEIFMTDIVGDGSFGGNGSGVVLPGTNIGSYGRSVSANALGAAIANYNTNFAGKLTPAGQALVNAGLFTSAQLSAIGAVAEPLAGAQPGTLYANDWLKAFDLRFSAPINVWKERVKIEPSISIYNVLNFADFAISPATRVSGTISASSLNGTTYSGLNSIRSGLGSGVFSLGAPRQLEYGLRVTF